MDFVVIDVETANSDYSSICQVGVASFKNGELADAWVSLVNPETPFGSFNVSIHGISAHQVKDAPTWLEIYPQVASRLQERIVVSHTQFDRVALERACLRANLPECECEWLDSAQVVRMAWPEFSRSGYGLTNVAEHFGIEYEAHDALEDARCAGLILLRAVEYTGISPEQWLVRAGHRAGNQGDPCGQTHREWKAYPAPVRRDGNPRGGLFGEVVVFTGELSISRKEAAEAAARAGCRVEDGVTKHTTILVVGDQDAGRLAGHDKSTKERKAEYLISKGQNIRILGEGDFKRLLLCAGTQNQG